MTEAAALACARWVGMGDKEAADGAAVDAMRAAARHRRGWTARSSSARGRRTRRRCSSTASASATGRRPRSTSPWIRSRARRLCARGSPNALAVIALAERGLDVRPRPMRLHGEDGGGQRARRPARPRPSAGGDAAADRRAQGHRHPRRDGGHPRPPAPPGGGHEIREAGARIRFIPDGDVAGALLASPRDAGRPAVGHRGTPEGVLAAAGDQVHRRADPRPSVAARRGGAARRARGRLRPRARPSTRTASWPARTCSSPPPA